MERPPAEELLKHAGFLRALAFRLVGDDARADDLVQEAYVAALEKPPRSAGKAWLGAVVRNLAGKMRRSEGRRRQRERAAPPPAPLPGLDDVTARIELHRNLVQAVDALNEPYRSTIVLRFLYDLKPRDVAARLKIPVETVRTRTQRALELLRGRIDRRKLALALLPLPARKATVGPALTWGIVMGTKRRVVVALALLALVTGGMLAVVARDGGNGTRTEEVRGRTEAVTTMAVEVPDGEAEAQVAALDDDPNRTAGPVINARGVVLLDGMPVSGAQVALRRAQPPVRLFDVRTQAYRRVTGPLRKALDETRTDAEGRFVLRCTHRTALTVEALAPGATPTRVLLTAPVTGDLTIRLRRGDEVEGRVVDETGAPVPAATVRWCISADRMPPIRGETTTDAEGRFRTPGGRFVWILAVAPGYAPATASGQQAARIVLERGGRVVGVVKSTAGAPIADADVLLATTAPAETRTDAQGRYELRLRRGHLVHALVHAPARLPLGSWTDELALPPQPVRAGRDLRFDIILPPVVRLYGTVVHGDNPVPEAQVALYRTNARMPVAVAGAASDALGRFAFGSVPDGAYELRATAGILRGRAAAHVVDAAAPDPVALTVAGTGRIEGTVAGDRSVTQVHLKAGRHADVDVQGRFVFEDVPPTDATYVHLRHTTARTEAFQVRPGETVRVVLDTNTARLLRGRVVDADGAPVGDALVALLEKRRFQHQHVWFSLLRERGTTTDGDGRFVAPLPDGAALAAVYQRDAAPALIDVDPEADELLVTLQPGRVVSGRVVWPGGEPVRDVRLKADPDRGAIPTVTDMQMRLYPTGEFELRGLGEGRIWIKVRHANGAAAPTVVESGTRDVVITLRRTLSIRGAVVDQRGRPVSAARITAKAPGKRGAGANSTHQGRFEIAALDDGTYDLHLEPGTHSDWHPPKLTPFVPTVVGGIAAGTHDVVVRVETGRPVKGVVLGPDGRPVAKAFVAALGVPGRLAPVTKTGAGGRFTLAGLTEEHREILVSARGFPARAVELGRGDLEIRLEQGEALRLRFLGPDGAPVAGQWVSASVVTSAIAARTSDWFMRLGKARRSAGSIAGGGAQTHADGRVAIDGLIPGEYRVNRFRTADGIAPETVVRTGAPERTVRLERAYSITGTVIDPAGNPVGSLKGSLWINVGAYRGEAQLGYAVVGVDGSFEIEGLTVGPVQLKVDYSGTPPGYRGKLTAQAGARNVRIVVTPQE